MNWSNITKTQPPLKRPTPTSSSSDNLTSSSRDHRWDRPNQPPKRPTRPSNSDYHKYQLNYHQDFRKKDCWVNLITNAYSVHTKHSNSPIYEYSIHISLSETHQDVSPHVLYKNFVSRAIRRTIIDGFIPQLIETSYVKGSVVIEQNLEAIYSTRAFKNKHQSSNLSIETQTNISQPEFQFKNISIKADLLCQLSIDITIKYVKTFTLSPTSLNFTLINSILHHQLWLLMLRYGAVYFVGQEQNREENRHRYHSSTKLDLMSEHVMGLSLSGLKHTMNNQAIVVIHCPHSYITKSHRLIDLLASLIRGNSVKSVRLDHQADEQSIKSICIREILDINGSEQWFEDFCSTLNGFKCHAINIDGASGLTLRFNITQESASRLFMEDSRVPGKLVTVQEYYHTRGINLNYPNLPCLRTKSVKYPYFPFELCSLLPDQKVPIFRLSLTARNHLNLLNKPKPQGAYWSSYNAKRKVESIAAHEFGAFGLSLSKVSVEARGLILDRPILQFKNTFVNPEHDHWESGQFYQAVDLIDNWCVVSTIEVNMQMLNTFFRDFSQHSTRYGVNLGRPHFLSRSAQVLLNEEDRITKLIEDCQRLTRGHLRLILFVIDSNSSQLNRLIHLSFDDHKYVSAACLRLESILNARQHRSIFRTLGHKLNARLGGTNFVYHRQSLEKLGLNPSELMIIGLDVTHPDNELKGFSIVGCAYTFSSDLFKHRSLVWPQAARMEIIGKMDALLNRIRQNYYQENTQRSPKNIIIYRDGVSHEEFEKVKDVEVEKALNVLSRYAKEKNKPEPNLSYIIAQKRHSMRFFQQMTNGSCTNPPSGTLIDRDVVSIKGREFYLYSNTGPQATARPLHYHVLLDGLSVTKLQELTYFLCFNFGKCSGSLSMPSSLKYAHNAAYDARNRVIASREFSENKFYTSKFFC